MRHRFVLHGSDTGVHRTDPPKKKKRHTHHPSTQKRPSHHLEAASPIPAPFLFRVSGGTCCSVCQKSGRSFGSSGRRAAALAPVAPVAAALQGGPAPRPGRLEEDGRDWEGMRWMVGATWRWLDWRLVLAASGKRNLGTPGTPGTLFWWRVVEPISWMSQDPLQRERERELYRPSPASQCQPHISRTVNQLPS